MAINHRTMASMAVGWLGYTGYLIKIVFVSVLYWMVGSMLAFIPLGLLSAYFDLSNRSVWAWELVILPPMAGIGVIYRYWSWIKTEAAKFSFLPDEEAIEAARLGLALVVGLPVLGVGLLLLCGLLWGGYMLLAALPVAVAIVVGAALIALAILRLASD